MIYNYIEKKLLRRAVVITHIFYDSEVYIEEIAKQMNVSSITIRNDLNYFEEKFSKQIQSIITTNGLISMKWYQDINLHDMLFDILKDSLFLKYLFITLIDMPVTASVICDSEHVSFSRARKLLIDIQEFISYTLPPNLDENQLEIKKRTIIICLSPYIDLKQLDELFDYTIKQQAIKILLKMIDNHIMVSSLKIQLFIALYLAIDNSLIHNFQINPNKKLLKRTIFYRQLKSELAQVIEPEYLDDECSYLALIFSHLYRAYIDDPTINSNIDVFNNSEEVTKAINELIVTIEYYFKLDKKHPIFQSTIQQFLTFNWMGFPIHLNFYRSTRYTELYETLYQVVSYWNEKHQLFNQVVEELVYILATYLYPLVNLKTIKKTILIVAPNTELYNIYKYTISNYFSPCIIMIDDTRYISVSDIPIELINENTIVVCDKSIKPQPVEKQNIAPISLYSLKDDLLKLNYYFKE